MANIQPERWFTLQECFEQAGSKFPFKITYKYGTIRTLAASMIVSRDPQKTFMWDTAANSCWRDAIAFSLATQSTEVSPIGCALETPCNSRECRKCTPNFL